MLQHWKEMVGKQLAQLLSALVLSNVHAKVQERTGMVGLPVFEEPIKPDSNVRLIIFGVSLGAQMVQPEADV